MRNSSTFDFPCSSSYRDFFSDYPHYKRRRPRLPLVPRSSDEEPFLSKIIELENENKWLRHALDLTNIALDQRGSIRPADPPKEGYGGIIP